MMHAKKQVLVGILLIATCVITFRTAQAGEVPGTAWPATDALGRALPTPEEVGPPRADRFVGIFYFLWLNKRDQRSPHWDGPYDVSRILAKDPQALQKPESTLWGRVGQYHYWGEPLFGYYLSMDPWILRRHAHMLADAGIDTLIFDATNAQTYRDNYLTLCRVFQEIRQAGGKTPQIAFMVNTRAGETAQRIYAELYEPQRYPELWFRWQGKPLMLCDPEQASPEVKEFFTLRCAHWPNNLINTPNAWHWEATYPQVYGYTDDPNKPEQVNVSVAQNLRDKDGKVTPMSNGDARGRSFHDGKKDMSPGAVNHGYNFSEQWQRADALQPPFVMVTGWNEWIAGRWGKPEGPLVFVDQFDEEYSRDIEPMKGGHGDNYYWQLVAGVRRYKGMPSIPPASKPVTISVGGGFEVWRDIAPEYRDPIGETQPREFDGAAGLHYANHSGRNDIVASKVARDAEMIYFYVRTREPLSPSSDPAWMWLLINIDQDAQTGWEGYDFIVNRQVTGKSTSLLEKNVGGWNWQSVAEVQFHAAGNELVIAIPRSAVGQSAESTALALDFKWADNLQHPGDAIDFWVSGDTAPDGRFAYRYVAE